MENSSNIKDRVLQLSDYKGISKEKFFEKIGVSYANFRGKSKGSDLGSKVIAEISSQFPDISIEWLVTGNGKMLLSEHPRTDSEHFIDKHGSPIGSSTKSLQSIPYYGDIDVTAGPDELFTDGSQQPSGYVSIPHFEDCDLAVPLWGDSMVPLYYSGQVVLCKEYTAWRDYLPYGEVFLVITESLRTVKYVKKASADDKYLLVSENPHFEPFEVPKKQILRMFIVKGAIKRNMI